MSTIDQSNESQSEELRRASAVHGWRSSKKCADQISGIKDARPGLQILTLLAEGEGVSIGTGTQKLLSPA